MCVVWCVFVCECEIKAKLAWETERDGGYSKGLNGRRTDLTQTVPPLPQTGPQMSWIGFWRRG